MCVYVYLNTSSINVLPAIVTHCHCSNRCVKKNNTCGIHIVISQNICYGINATKTETVIQMQKNNLLCQHVFKVNFKV